MDARKDITLTIVGEGNGSGGLRATNYEAMKEQSQELKALFNEDGTLYILVAGSSGGTSLVLPYVLPMLSNVSTAVILANDTRQGHYADNTLKTWKSLLGFAQTRESLFMFKVDNENRAYAEINKAIVNFSNALALFFSDELNNGLDRADMLNAFNQKTLPTTHHKALYGIDIVANGFSPDGVVLSRELVVDGNYNGVIEPNELGLFKQGRTINDTKLYPESIHKLILTVTRNAFDEDYAKLVEDVDGFNSDLSTVAKIDVGTDDDITGDDDEFIIM